MRIITLFIIFISLIATGVAFSQDSNTDSLTMGTIHTLQSEVLNESRSISVCLPEGYNESEDSYPVAYVLDGGMKFQMMHAASTMEMMDGGGLMPQMIIVGMDNTNSVRDHFPQPRGTRPGSGQADNYIRFIQDELVPWVNANYRANNYRILIGASNSGMLTVYTLLTNPDLFSAYIAASPSVGWFPDFMTEQVTLAGKREQFPAISLYMNYGTNDLESIVLNAIDTFIVTCESQAPKNLRWTMEKIEDGGHVPYISLYNGFLFIFNDWQCPDTITSTAGIDGVIEYYRQLSTKYGFDIKVPSDYFTDLGIGYIRSGNVDSALTVFEAYTKTHTRSPRAHYYLGSSYLRAGDTTKAISCLEEAVRIDPEYEVVKNKLDELKAKTETK